MIETARLSIRYANISDIDDIYEYVGDPIVMKYERQNYPTKESYLEVLEYLAEHHLLFVVSLKGQKQVIGQIFLSKTNPEINNEYNIGYIFNPKFYNKGYCTEAAKAVMDYSFHNLNANRVRAASSSENIPSWKVMEKIGLKKEGTLVNRFFVCKDKDNKSIFTDEVVYGIDKNEWKKSLK